MSKLLRTRSGERREMIRHASIPLNGSNSNPRVRAAIEVPFNPLLRRRSSSSPSRGMTRDSIPRAVPANVTRASG